MIGFALGAGVGVFLGEYAGPLGLIGDVWIRLLQMAILPYIVLSLISAIGGLTYSDARLIAGRAGIVMLGVWIVAIAVVWLVAFTFPVTQTASFFSVGMLESPTAVDFRELYIPTNPFHSMANNVVPAVVLFSLLVGAAMIGVENKERVLPAINVGVDALTRVTMVFVKLTPIGVFALTAAAAGTMAIEDLGRLQVYFGAFIVGSLLITLWFLPVLVAIATPIHYREFLGTCRDTLVTALGTGNLYVCLPLIVKNCETLLAKHIESDRAEKTVDALVPIGFAFPHAGKIMTLLFVLFAAWFVGVDLTPTSHATLVISGVFSVFASTHVAIPFLLDSVRVPADMYQLYLTTGIINARFAAMAAAMSLLAFSLIASVAVEGQARVVLRRVVAFGLASIVVVGITVTLARNGFQTFVTDAYDKDEVIAGMQILADPAPAVVRTALTPVQPDSIVSPVLDRIRGGDVLRVGYVAGRLPWSFFNGAGDLVGFDVEAAHLIAKDIDASLEFVPMDIERFDEQLNQGQIDIAMSGLMMSPYRLEQVRFVPYVEQTIGFVMPDERRNEFDSVKELVSHSGLAIALVGDEFFRQRVIRLVPDARVTLLDSVDEFTAQRDEYDLMITTAESGSAWTLLHPEYAVVVPSDLQLRLPAGYAVAADQEELARFLSGWVTLNQANGWLDGLYDHWVLGVDAKPRQPRWSVIRDVLGWVE